MIPPAAQRPAVESALDFQLARRAAEAGIAVAGLESFRFQQELLRELVGSGALSLSANDNQQMAELAALYRSGSLEGIEALSAEATPEENERLISGRNRRWADKLTPLLQRGGLFIAVGVAHCPGDQGLLSLLHTRGYSTRRLTR
jgi:uncharacterized protein YbaP (TraB family)